MFYELEPCMKPMYDGCVNNRNNWQALSDKNNEGKIETLINDCKIAQQ